MKKLTIRCAVTGKSAQVKPTPSGAPRPPAGWKHHNGQYYSAEGWRSLFILRAIIIPVAGPHGDTEWADLREIFKTAWGQATSLSNWAISELSRRDIVRRAEMPKLPALDARACYLYPAARAQFPAIPTNSVVAILNAVGGRYRKLRYELVWRSSISLPSYCYPTPFPVHNQAWKASYTEDDRRAPLVTANLGGQKMRLRLRGGVEFRRQLSAFAQIVSGEAVAGELALYERRVSLSSHRNGITLNGSQGEARSQSRVMCKMVAWLPRQAKLAPAAKKRELALCTAPQSLLLATIEGRQEPWLYNADHARRWVAQELRHMERLRQDLKAEARRSPRREQMLSRMASWSSKHTRRLDTLCHQASAALVNFALRQKATHICYDDGCRDYLPSFPWAKLREYLLYKADEAHIELTYHAGAEAPTKEP